MNRFVEGDLRCCMAFPESEVEANGLAEINANVILEMRLLSRRVNGDSECTSFGFAVMGSRQKTREMI